jgi:DNA topoisomerase-1
MEWHNRLVGNRGAPVTDPKVSAKLAGLRYVTDRMPGIRRLGAGKAFRYVGPDGRAIQNADVLRRIKSLAIPPAWTEVWICPIEEAHLQAVGRDARRRKQYRYHPRWREVRDSTKYHRMAGFGKVLPQIRGRVQRDLETSGLTREKVLATIVRLLETTHIRVGNEEYTRQNNSFGLTTLRNHHVDVSGNKLHFYFRGKSGVKHAISVEDPHLARIVRRLLDLPGYELFQYVDDDGVRRSIDSGDVNAYIRDISGDDYTAKDFRTWAATVLAAWTLRDLLPFSTNAQARKNIVKAIASVAKRLGNTVSVCRKCYIHPAVIQAYLDKSLADALAKSGPRSRLRTEEAAVLRFLESQARVQARESKRTMEQKLFQSIRQQKRRR